MKATTPKRFPCRTIAEVQAIYENLLASQQISFDQMNAQIMRLIRQRNYWRARAREREENLPDSISRKGILKGPPARR